MSEIDQLLDDLRVVYNKMAWLNGDKMKKALEGYTASEVHWLEFIENTPDVNVTKLSEHFFMTRGAMSKATKKLIAKGAIYSIKKADNKKEIYFELTEEGRRVYNLHETLHQEFKIRDKHIFDTLSKETISEVDTFLKKYNQHLTSEIKKNDLKIQ
ncbi:MarR family winged helix-turn-helix transcriptional regulator [Vagococcus carniphilus]|uniref:MarR family transcriptional regulator n=1 Tax=Vagococcus carniphilus TaxID=218144 RepID=A0A430B6M0_9ENTE|nr:MarR family transcriptional regulator [Vagococcus carniphilus]MDT2815219.1 MarR family transcriptional regulator [Vagococcus carniphilus]MDT2831122.1 MarR family transcriptional regulator [Vagococcus carniphilus]MDT2833310.1 MarR family transcriptional regulator [Vagococcus carniphilus]MDT2839719.1 MarR family transcriptional regulator [Vagococcus carniphilus]MDT2849153.1 MarR family transcriptional regulator [Vagococcus carniphilus]